MREKDYYGAIKGFCLKWNLPEVWNSDRITGANLIYEVIKVINAMINELREYEDQVDGKLDVMKEMIDDFLKVFDENLSDTVKDRLTVWLNEGTLENIINETLFNRKADKTYVDGEINRIDDEIEDLDNDIQEVNTQLAQTEIDVLDLESGKASKTELNNGLNTKVDKGGNEQVTWGMLSQGAKENITGGNTAVVGVNSVNTSNVVDKAITSEKRTVSGNQAILYTSNGAPNFDFKNKKLYIPNNIRVASGGKWYFGNPAFNEPVTLDLNTQSAQYGIIMLNTDTLMFSDESYASLVGKDINNMLEIAVYNSVSRTVFMKSPFLIEGEYVLSDGKTKFAITYPNLNPLDFELGNIQSGTGDVPIYSNALHRIRSKNFISVKKGWTLAVSDSQKYDVAMWFFESDNDSSYIKRVSFTEIKTPYVIEEDCYVKLVLAEKGVLDLTDKEFELLQQYRLYPTGEYHIEERSDKEIIVNDSGRELAFSFPITLQNSYMSDHTFVGEELWIFPVSNDAHTNWSTVLRYNVDMENQTANLLGTFDHNWGHVNTVDYQNETDCLVLGNGGGSGNTEPNEFYIFQNASSLKDLEQVDVYEHAIVYEIANDGFDWGKQLNVIWGQSNGGKHNIVYALSNYNSETGTSDSSTTSSDTQVIHKLLLGQGSNVLENGSYQSGKGQNEFNGTYKVLKKYEHPYEYDYANQGTTFYNGKIYEGIGHDRLSFFEKVLDDSGRVDSKLFRERLWDDLGDELNLTVEGIDIKDNHIFLGEVGRRIYVYKL